MTIPQFRRWLTDTLQVIEPQIGEPPAPQFAELVALAKANCYALGLHDFALSLPDDAECKSPLTAANQLRRCLQALDTDSPPANGGAMNVAQAAGLLGVSKETVYGLCSDGLLQHTRIGRRITISPQQLADYQRQQTLVAPRQPGQFRHI